MMFSIIEHIEYLMSCHDCVVVPGWGAFIANYSMADYDTQRSVYGRPQRSVGFNAGVTHNDGLLAHSLMRREGLSYEESMRFIADSVTAFAKQLSMGGEVSVGRLGYFVRREGRYDEFVPFTNVNASNRYYGLADVDVRTVTALERVMQEESEAPMRVERGLFSRRATRIAASIAVLLGLGVLLSTPVIVDREHLDMASMTPKVTAPQVQTLGVTVEQGVTTSAIEVVEPYPSIAAMGSDAGKYYMVIATLRNQQELDAFKRSYPSLVPHMKLLDYKGMTCVYVARSDDYGQLMSLRDELPERLRDVWIYN